MRRFWSLEGNTQKLDGGSMFGNAPRALWERWAAPDDRHRIDLACRALLMREDAADGQARWVLFETGIGAFFEPKLKDRFGVQEDEHVLLDSLAELDLTHEDIDLVVLSHLHFDHAGGLLSAWKPKAARELLFPNARYLVSRAAWERALAPHTRDRASFIPELHVLLEASGRLELVDGPSHPLLGEGIHLHYADGHTVGLMMSEFDTAEGPLLFASDLIPGRPWIHSSITMGYDRYPEQLIDEKTALLDQLVARGGRVFFTHDPACCAARVVKDARGRFGSDTPITRLCGES